MRFLMKAALLCAILLTTLPALFSQTLAVGNHVLDNTGNPLASGQWCFNGTCTAVTSGAFSGSVTSGTATITITNGGSTTYLTIPGASISGSYFSFDTYVVPSTATITGLGAPRIACTPGAKYTQTDGALSTWACVNINGTGTWNGLAPAGPALSIGQGGTGCTTSACAIAALGGLQAANNLSDVASSAAALAHLNGVSTVLTTPQSLASPFGVPQLNGKYIVSTLAYSTIDACLTTATPMVQNYLNGLSIFYPGCAVDAAGSGIYTVGAANSLHGFDPAASCAGISPSVVCSPPVDNTQCSTAGGAACKPIPLDLTLDPSTYSLAAPIILRSGLKIHGVAAQGQIYGSVIDNAFDGPTFKYPADGTVVDYVDIGNLALNHVSGQTTNSVALDFDCGSQSTGGLNYSNFHDMIIGGGYTGFRGGDIRMWCAASSFSSIQVGNRIWNVLAEDDATESPRSNPIISILGDVGQLSIRDSWFFPESPDSSTVPIMQIGANAGSEPVVTITGYSVAGNYATFNYSISGPALACGARISIPASGAGSFSNTFGQTWFNGQTLTVYCGTLTSSTFMAYTAAPNQTSITDSGSGTVFANVNPYHITVDNIAFQSGVTQLELSGVSYFMAHKIHRECGGNICTNPTVLVAGGSQNRDIVFDGDTYQGTSFAQGVGGCYYCVSTSGTALTMSVTHTDYCGGTNFIVANANGQSVRDLDNYPCSSQPPVPDSGTIPSVTAATIINANNSVIQISGSSTTICQINDYTPSHRLITEISGSLQTFALASNSACSGVSGANINWSTKQNSGTSFPQQTTEIASWFMDTITGQWTLETISPKSLPFEKTPSGSGSVTVFWNAPISTITVGGAITSLTISNSNPVAQAGDSFLMTFKQGGTGYSVAAPTGVANWCPISAVANTVTAQRLTWSPQLNEWVSNGCIASLSRGTTVANLPAASSSSGQFWDVTDGTSSTDCSTGGGSSLVRCGSNGSAWSAVQGAAGGAIPRAVAYPFTAAASTSNNQGGFFTTEAAVTISQFDVYVPTGPSGCSTNMVAGIYDFTASAFIATTTVSANHQNSNTGLSVAVPSGHLLGIGVQTGYAGCTTNPSSPIGTIVYH